jgi:uncharacterized protein YndB with AHSA1/START domain
MPSTRTLNVTLAGDRDIVLTRVFDAPRALVFKAFTDPALISQWWGRRNHATTVDKMELAPGGGWRFIERDGDGNEFGFRGVYREIQAPVRLVYTFEYDGMPGYISLEVIVLEEHDGVTTATNTVAFHTTEDRDGMIASGMEGGATESMDRLAELLGTMAH